VVPNKALRELMLKWVAKADPEEAPLTEAEAEQAEQLIPKHCPELRGLLDCAKRCVPLCTSSCVRLGAWCACLACAVHTVCAQQLATQGPVFC
jgi:hypothetical protein